MFVDPLSITAGTSCRNLGSAAELETFMYVVGVDQKGEIKYMYAVRTQCEYIVSVLLPMSRKTNFNSGLNVNDNVSF